MAESNDATAIRARKIERMGPELGRFHYELWNELAWLFIKWKHYRHLYATSDATVAILNAAAPSFFYFLNTILFEDVLLHMARLTDPPEQGLERTNLTLQRLPALVSDDPALVPDAGLRARAENLLRVVLARTEFARVWRNRRIAHRDLRTYRRQHPTPLPGASRQNVEDALEAMRDLMNTLEYAFENSTTAFEAYIGSGGADWLTACLEIGIRYREEDLKRRGDLRRRGIDPDLPS
jgi:hypothetical protein